MTIYIPNNSSLLLPHHFCNIFSHCLKFQDFQVLLTKFQDDCCRLVLPCHAVQDATDRTLPRWGRKVLLLAVIPVPLEKVYTCHCRSGFKWRTEQFFFYFTYGPRQGFQSLRIISDSNQRILLPGFYHPSVKPGNWWGSNSQDNFQRTLFVEVRSLVCSRLKLKINWWKNRQQRVNYKDIRFK